MKITALETIRLDEFPNVLLWVRLHTDEGLSGLGETFCGIAMPDVSWCGGLTEACKYE